MKKLVCLLSAMLFSAGVQASPVDSKDVLGVGVMIGSATSLTAQKHIDDLNAIDLAYGANANSEGRLHADYLRHFQQFSITNTVMPYVGLGLGAGFNRTWNNEKRGTDVFARLPIGLTWYPQDYNLGVFAEVAPAMVITPVSAGYTDANLGARYYF